MRACIRLLLVVATLCVCWLWIASCAPSADYRGMQVADLTVDNPDGSIFQNTYGKSWLVAVGIDKYVNLDRLRHAVSDARSIVKLFEGLGFSTVSMYDNDATKSAVMTALSDVMMKAGPNDRVVFFFAGHGVDLRDDSGNVRGYLVPVEGKSRDADSLIPMDWLQVDAIAEGKTKAKHVLYLLDACSSGIVASRSSVTVDRSVSNYIAELMKRTARQVITAGTGEQQVLDGGYKGHSIFAGLILKGLEEGGADINNDYHVTATELGLYLSQRVYIESGGAQKPDFAKLIGTRGGDVILKFPTAEETKLLEERKKPVDEGKASIILDIRPVESDVMVYDDQGELIAEHKRVQKVVKIPGLVPGDYQVIVKPAGKKYAPVKLIVGAYGSVIKQVNLPRNRHKVVSVPFL